MPVASVCLVLIYTLSVSPFSPCDLPPAVDLLCYMCMYKLLQKQDPLTCQKLGASDHGNKGVLSARTTSVVQFRLCLTHLYSVIIIIIILFGFCCDISPPLL